MASVLEELRAAVAALRAAMLQPMQPHEEARKDHLQQQWGHHVVNVAHADIAAFASASASVSPPTSTLSFSESAQQASVLEELRAAVAAARAAMPQPMQAHEEVCKDHLQQQQWGDHVVDVADADIAAAAFAGMLLDDSLIQQQTEEGKKYGESIMNLVNSSSASLLTSVARPALQVSSSSASLQTSRAREAYSSSASLSTLVADCARAREAYSSSASLSTLVADCARAREAYSSSASLQTLVADCARAQEAYSSLASLQTLVADCASAREAYSLSASLQTCLRPRPS